MIRYDRFEMVHQMYDQGLLCKCNEREESIYTDEDGNMKTVIKHKEDCEAPKVARELLMARVNEHPQGEF